MELSIEIIKTCMQNCIYCSSESKNDDTEQLSTEEVLKVIHDLNNVTTLNRVSLSGGEPFLHDNMLDIVSGIRAINPSTEVIIYTSGITRNAQSISKRTMDKLKKLGIHSIIFNLPALTPSKYNELTGTTTRIARVLASIGWAVGAGIRVELNVVPNKINIDDIDNIMDYCDGYEVQAVNFLGLVEHGRANTNKDKLGLSADEQISLMQKLDKMYTDRKKHKSLTQIRIGTPLRFNCDECNACNACNGNKLYIKHNGDVHICETFKYFKETAGSTENEGVENGASNNIHKNSICDIIQTSKRLKWEKQYLGEHKNNLCENKISACPMQP